MSKLESLLAAAGYELAAVGFIPNEEPTFESKFAQFHNFLM